MHLALSLPESDATFLLAIMVYKWLVPNPNDKCTGFKQTSLDFCLSSILTVMLHGPIHGSSIVGLLCASIVVRMEC